jgi:hypothetical protein
MPAMAAARGVFKRARIKSVSCSRAILLKVLDDISHRREPVNAPNPILRRVLHMHPAKVGLCPYGTLVQ